jgi:hypothetical protein
VRTLVGYLFPFDELNWYRLMENRQFYLMDFAPQLSPLASTIEETYLGEYEA